MQLNFIKDIQLDVKNWQNAIKAESYSIDWKKYIPTDLSVDCIQIDKCLTDYLNNYYYNNGLIDAYLKRLKNEVNILEIQNDLEFLVKRKFPNKIGINVLITTFQRCPYNTKDIFFYIRYRANKEAFDKSITNIYHELMHFLFHWNYWQKCQSAGLKENQIHNIKEAFTILLNPILVRKNLPLDKGYEVNFNLRDEIMEFWRQNNDFEFVLNKVINIANNQDYV